MKMLGNSMCELLPPSKTFFIKHTFSLLLFIDFYFGTTIKHHFILTQQAQQSSTNCNDK